MHISETDRGFHSKPITLTSIILGFGCTNFDCIRVWRAQFCAAGREGKGKAHLVAERRRRRGSTKREAAVAESSPRGKKPER